MQKHINPHISAQRDERSSTGAQRGHALLSALTPAQLRRDPCFDRGVPAIELAWEGWWLAVITTYLVLGLAALIAIGLVTYVGMSILVWGPRHRAELDADSEAVREKARRLADRGISVRAVITGRTDANMGGELSRAYHIEFEAMTTAGQPLKGSQMKMISALDAVAMETGAEAVARYDPEDVGTYELLIKTDPDYETEHSRIAPR